MAYLRWKTPKIKNFNYGGHPNFMKWFQKLFYKKPLLYKEKYLQIYAQC